MRILLFCHHSIDMEREFMLSLNAGMKHFNECWYTCFSRIISGKKLETGLGFLVLAVI